jgi:hypothetical protein
MTPAQSSVWREGRRSICLKRDCCGKGRITYRAVEYLQQMLWLLTSRKRSLRSYSTSAITTLIAMALVVIFQALASDSALATNVSRYLFAWSVRGLFFTRRRGNSRWSQIDAESPCCAICTNNTCRTPILQHNRRLTRAALASQHELRRRYFHPHRRMIARAIPGARCAIDIRSDGVFAQRIGHQRQIDA